MLYVSCNKFTPAETRVEYRAGIEPGPAVQQAGAVIFEMHLLN